MSLDMTTLITAEQKEATRQANKLAQIESSITQMLNEAAHSKGYDSIHTAALRASLPNSPFNAEGIAFGEWMDACFAKAYSMLGEWQAGNMAEPTIEEVLLQMPELVLP